jgi:RimJ/RimL family protein N-acetyltransferase
LTPSARLPYTFDAPLRTERLVVRTFRREDVDDVHAYHSREDVCRYVPQEPRTRDEVAEKLEKWSSATVLAGDGDFWQLAVERAGTVIGNVYASIKDAASAGAEVGWMLHPDHSGQGYMTEACTALLDLLFEHVGIHRVHAVLDPRNGPSIALCKRLGMRAEAYFVEDLWFKGEWGDTGIYAVLDREWTS